MFFCHLQNVSCTLIFQTLGFTRCNLRLVSYLNCFYCVLQTAMFPLGYIIAPIIIYSVFFPETQQPYSCLGRPIGEVSRSHAVRHTTLGRTLLDEGAAQRRNLCLHNTQHSQKTDMHPASGSRTHNPSKRSAADPRLWPRGCRNRRYTY